MANNIETENILKNINNLKNTIISNFDNNNRIINTDQIYFDGVEIPLTVFNAFVYSMERSWFSNEILARLFMAVKYYPREFNWNSIYTGDFETELSYFHL